MWKFKSLTGRDKWLFLLTIGVILCILAFPVGNGALSVKKTSGSVTERETQSGTGESPLSGEDNGLPASAKAESAYERRLEERVKEILKDVDGVGEVEVMIVLKSSAEKVVQVDNSSSRSVTEEQDSSGGTRKIESQEQEHSTVLTGGGTDAGPIIAKEVYPEISGIIISATGGGSPTVQAEISAAMEALFGLPPHKIKVLKRVE